MILLRKWNMNESQWLHLLLHLLDVLFLFTLFVFRQLSLTVLLVKIFFIFFSNFGWAFNSVPFSSRCFIFFSEFFVQFSICFPHCLHLILSIMLVWWFYCFYFLLFYMLYVFYEFYPFYYYYLLIHIFSVLILCF